MTFLPRDFIETAEGLVFAVVDAHPENDRVLAFLRYAPSAAGLRKVATDAANELLALSFPRYLHRSDRLQADLHGVPIADIRRHHHPRDRVRQLFKDGARDELEAKLLKLLQLLTRGGVEAESLGVTGSVLIGRQNAASDLDVVVYGKEDFFRARMAISQALAQEHIQELDRAGWTDAYRRRGCALSFDDFVRHERRKLNKGAIGGTKFDLALVEEAPPVDPLRWRKLGPARVEARVMDDSGAYGHPARYVLDHPQIGEVLSFTHTYVGQALRGERIQAAGFAEASESGKKRLIVGSSREAPGEYLRVLW